MSSWQELMFQRSCSRRYAKVCAWLSGAVSTPLMLKMSTALHNNLDVEAASAALLLSQHLHLQSFPLVIFWPSKYFTFANITGKVDTIWLYCTHTHTHTHTQTHTQIGPSIIYTQSFISLLQTLEH